MDLDMLENLKNRLNLSSLGKPALVGIAVILVLVAVAAGRMFLGTATANQFEVSHSSGATLEEQAPGADGGGAGDEAEPPKPASIFVHVSGEVVSPGLCEVPEGSRVADAVQAAGGFTDEAAADSVNLARALVDGEQIIVADKKSQAQAVAAVPQASQQAPAASSPAAGATGLVNINTASEAELKTLPGVGDVTAKKITDDREAHGPFKAKEDLKRVSGIGDKTYEKLADLICI